MSCGLCSRDGWIVVKNEAGVFTAKRCPCWVVRHPEDAAGIRYAQAPEQVA